MLHCVRRQRVEEKCPRPSSRSSSSFASNPSSVQAVLHQSAHLPARCSRGLSTTAQTPLPPCDQQRREESITSDFNFIPSSSDPFASSCTDPGIGHLPTNSTHHYHHSDDASFNAIGSAPPRLVSPNLSSPAPTRPQALESCTDTTRPAQKRARHTKKRRDLQARDLLRKTTTTAAERFRLTTTTTYPSTSSKMALNPHKQNKVDVSVRLHTPHSHSPPIHRRHIVPDVLIPLCESLTPFWQSLTEEEQKLFRLYGKLPNKKDLFSKKLQERKYFDSGDYAMSKAGKNDDASLSGGLGREHPT